MKNLLLISILLILNNLVLAQNRTVTGTVTDKNKISLLGVNVSLENTTKKVQTNKSGKFEIKNIENGDYILLISYLGFKTREIPVLIYNNRNINLKSILLYKKNEILREVEIKSERTNKFSRKKTAYVSKLPLKDIENTQVYSTVTNEILKSQVVTDFDDALKNATGLEKLWTSTGRNNGAGYYSLRGFSLQPQLVNGLPGLTNGRVNPANIERIEVLKGPSATLFGNAVSSYGGLINVVTKKPYFGKGGELSFVSGSYGLNRIIGDFNTALSKKENLYFRLNTAYTSTQSFQDAGFKKSFFVAPTLYYKLNDKMSFNFYAEITQAEQTNPTFLFLPRTKPSAASNLKELGYDYKRSFTSNDLTLHNPAQNYRVEMDYKLSENWKSQTLISKSSTATKGYYSYLFDFGNFKKNTFSRYISKQNANTQTTDIQQNFIGDFKVLSVRNRIVFGLDYFNQTQTNNNTAYTFFGNVLANGNTNGDNPATTAVENNSYQLSTSAVDSALVSKGVNNQKTKFNIYSLYVSEVINFTDNLLATAGLRLNYFNNQGDILNSEDDYNQTTLSPKLGIIYQPIKDQLSIFGNYQNGFTNVAPQLVGNPANGPQKLQNFKPEQANQLEFGIKTNFFNNRLSTTISYYYIRVKDRVITDPSSPFNKIQGGEVLSKGFEIEINTNPIKGLNIKAGYSNNNSETVKSDNTNILNRRPLEAGPATLYNLWADYQFQKGTLKGFGIALGFNGVSERFAINYKSTGEFILPSYTIANASIFYQAEKYRIGLKLNNAFNKEYYKGWTTINPQMPRALLVNISYKF